MSTIEGLVYPEYQYIDFLSGMGFESFPQPPYIWPVLRSAFRWLTRGLPSLVIPVCAQDPVEREENNCVKWPQRDLTFKCGCQCEWVYQCWGGKAPGGVAHTPLTAAAPWCTPDGLPGPDSCRRSSPACSGSPPSLWSARKHIWFALCVLLIQQPPSAGLYLYTQRLENSGGDVDGELQLINQSLHLFDLHLYLTYVGLSVIVGVLLHFFNLDCQLYYLFCIRRQLGLILF